MSGKAKANPFTAKDAKDAKETQIAFTTQSTVLYILCG